MREIKFRAWDKERKDMYYINDFYWFEEEGVHDSNGEGHYANYILMQYTGLKDKNGKEIYEGDIVEINHGENHKWCEEVIFHTGCFMAGDENLLINVVDYVTVLGNIYEHPQLLGDSDSK